MISLDQKILDSHSAVAERMRRFNNTDIIIPSAKNLELVLSENVKAYGTGGNKISQFFKVIKLGKKLQAQNSFDVITAQDPFLTALAALLIRKKELVEIQVHGDFFSNFYFVTSSPKNWCYYWLARLLTLPSANRFRVVGERVKQSLRALGIKLEKIEVRPVIFDAQKCETYVPQKDVKKEFPGFRKYFLYVGRLEKEKNVAWLIKVFDQYLQQSNNNDVLLIVGDGSKKESLKHLTNNLKRNKEIKFIGWSNEPLEYIKVVDCVLVPSMAEGYGLVPMEAAAAGTRIIMTDVGVAGYELPASEQVIIVPVNDRVAFIQSLKKM